MYGECVAGCGMLSEEVCDEHSNDEPADDDECGGDVHPGRGVEDLGMDEELDQGVGYVDQETNSDTNLSRNEEDT